MEPSTKAYRRALNPMRAVVTLRKLENLCIVVFIVCWWLGERPVVTAAHSAPEMN